MEDHNLSLIFNIWVVLMGRACLHIPVLPGYVQGPSSLLVSGGVPGTAALETAAANQHRYCEQNHLPLTGGVQPYFGVRVTQEKTSSSAPG